jgi:hypothetical protein
MRVVCAFLFCLLVGTGAAHAQRATAAVVPEAITVGDVFHAAVRFDLPAGVELMTPDTLVLPEDVESAGAPEIRVDSTDAGPRVTLLYPLAAWRPGKYRLPGVTLRFRTTQGDRQLQVQLPDFSVNSVLPQDTTGIKMKAAKDVLGKNRIWWPWILLALLLLAALLGYLWWRRRHRPEEPVVIVPPVPAREVALERLAALRRSGMLERGEVKPYYNELGETVRHYAVTADPAWSVDLTTNELAHNIRTKDVSLLDIIRVLGNADLVKFAKARPPAEVGHRDLDAAQSWVERTSAPPPQVAATDLTAEPRRVA